MIKTDKKTIRDFVRSMSLISLAAESADLGRTMIPCRRQGRCIVRKASLI